MSKINYDLSLIKALVFDVDGVLSPSTIPMGDDGIPQRMVNVKDGYAMQLALKHGLRISIISGADSKAVERRFKLLGIHDVIINASHKLPILLQWIDKNGLKPQEIIYVGDDIPDYECMKAVGLAVAPADAAIEIREIAQYITPMAGGYGVARDLIEEILKSRGEWMKPDTAYHW
ncbi:MAG: HAD-IIIA family hydrolase [Clostridiales bacterium]|nr:HAD-IIIA family hydrolase [Clostridiales bacterium]